MTIWEWREDLISTSKMKYTNNKKVNEDLIYFISILPRQNHVDILSHIKNSV